MMEKLMIGIDLRDIRTQAAVMGREEAWEFPTALCRENSADEWHVGEEAYRLPLVGEGVIVDKLLTLAQRDGTATIGAVKYTGGDLLKKFLELILKTVMAECGDAEVGRLVISLQSLEMKLMDELMYCADHLKIPRSCVRIVSQTECFAYYVLSQRRDVWGGQVGMFSLSEEDLRYFEMKAVRGPRQMTVIAEREVMEEGFSLDVLDKGTGPRMADKILCSCADRIMQKKLYSSVFLTGKGFSRTDWAPEFMKMVCNRRRVFAEPCLFAKGAAMKAEDSTHEKTSYPFVCLCEGKLRATVSVRVVRRDAPTEMVLAAAGENWYEARSTMEVILDRQNDLEFTVAPQDSRQKRLVRIPLDGFPDRPDKTTRVQVTVGFLDEHTMVVKAEDKGFGELFPGTDASVRQEVMV